MASAVLRRRANSRYLAEAMEIRARLVSKLRRLSLVAARSESHVALAALYRARLEELDLAIRRLAPRMEPAADAHPGGPRGPAPGAGQRRRAARPSASQHERLPSASARAAQLED